MRIYPGLLGEGASNNLPYTCVQTASAVDTVNSWRSLDAGDSDYGLWTCEMWPCGCMGLV